MKINGIDISTYGAGLVSKVLESSEIHVDKEWSKKSLLPFIDSKSWYGFKTLILDIEFKGDFKTTNLNKSKFISNLSTSVITDIGLEPNTLTGVVESQEVILENQKYQRIKYTMLVIEEAPEIITTASSITNLGTGDAPTKIEITPSTSGNYTLIINKNTSSENKIILNNMKSGVTRIIGVEVGIFEGTNNVFEDTIIFEYPKFIPGVNNITITPNTATLKSTFKARII